MIARTFRVVTIGLVCMAMASAASAETISDFFDGVARDTKRRVCWPKPFACQDRQAVRAPFVTMVANGWERQNMLSDYHFEMGTGTLTEAGRLKIEWILFEAPEQHRQVFVRRSINAEEMASRMANVHEYIAQLMPQGDIPPIFESTMPNPGWPAERVDRVGRKFYEVGPPPSLPSLDDAAAK
ncbi:MAG: hypothetical protein ACOY3P_22710 [Planctomycetota bacterium]